MFCRNCGKDIAGHPKVCPNCNSSPISGSSFCRYCGAATTDQDATCPKCEAALKATGNAGKGLSKTAKKRLIALGVAVVLVYAVLATPTRVIIKPLQTAISNIILSTTGYTAMPLQAISAKPFAIPVPEYDLQQGINIARFSVGQTQQLAISAEYTTDGSTSSGVSKDVTSKCTFQCSNDQVATVSSAGLVTAVGNGDATITVSYTAIPGTSDRANAAQGKIPKTFTVSVAVNVR